jgi:hypothetical protein
MYKSSTRPSLYTCVILAPDFINLLIVTSPFDRDNNATRESILRAAVTPRLRLQHVFVRRYIRLLELVPCFLHILQHPQEIQPRQLLQILHAPLAGADQLGEQRGVRRDVLQSLGNAANSFFIKLQAFASVPICRGLRNVTTQLETFQVLMKVRDAIRPIGGEQSRGAVEAF